MLVGPDSVTANAPQAQRAAASSLATCVPGHSPSDSNSCNNSRQVTRQAQRQLRQNELGHRKLDVLRGIDSARQVCFQVLHSNLFQPQA